MNSILNIGAVHKDGNAELNIGIRENQFRFKRSSSDPKMVELTDSASNEVLKFNFDTSDIDKASKLLCVHMDANGNTDYSSEEIIEHIRKGGYTTLEHIDVGECTFMWTLGDVVCYGAAISLDDKIGIWTVTVTGNYATGSMSYLAKAEDVTNLQSNITYLQSKIDNAITTHRADMDNAAILAKTTMPGALKWDGIIDYNKFVGIVSAEGIYGYVRIYDEYPEQATMIPPADYENLVYVAFTQQEDTYAQSMTLTKHDDGLISIGTVMEGPSSFIYFIPTDNYSIAISSSTTCIFPKKGIYAFVMKSISDGIEVPFVHVTSLYTSLFSFGNNLLEVAPTGGNTLYFDGNTDGLIVVDNMYRISTATPSVEDFVDGSTASASGLTFNIKAANFDEDSDDLVIVYMVGFESAEPDGLTPFACVVRAENAKMGTITFAHTGIYVLDYVANRGPAKLFIPDYTGFPSTKLKSELLPEHLQFGEELKSTCLGSVKATAPDSFTWDYNVSGLPLVAAGSMYQLTSAAPSFEELQAGMTIYFMTSSGRVSDTLVPTRPDDPSLGGLILLMLPGSNVAVLAVAETETYLGGDINATIAPGIYIAQAMVDLSKNQGYTECGGTISGYTGFIVEEVKKINEKYLPPAVQFTIWEDDD